VSLFLALQSYLVRNFGLMSPCQTPKTLTMNIRSSNVYWGGHHADPCTLTVSDLLHKPLFKYSAATCFEHSVVHW